MVAGLHHRFFLILKRGIRVKILGFGFGLGLLLTFFWGLLNKILFVMKFKNHIVVVSGIFLIFINSIYKNLSRFIIKFSLIFLEIN